MNNIMAIILVMSMLKFLSMERKYVDNKED